MSSLHHVGLPTKFFTIRKSYCGLMQLPIECSYQHPRNFIGANDEFRYIDNVIPSILPLPVWKNFQMSILTAFNSPFTLNKNYPASFKNAAVSKSQYSSVNETVTTCFFISAASLNFVLFKWRICMSYNVCSKIPTAPCIITLKYATTVIK